jgi:hypothetical protein
MNRTSLYLKSRSVLIISYKIHFNYSRRGDMEGALPMLAM